jgi:hypothetical protein
MDFTLQTVVEEEAKEAVAVVVMVVGSVLDDGEGHVVSWEGKMTRARS